VKIFFFKKVSILKKWKFLPHGHGESKECFCVINIVQESEQDVGATSKKSAIKKKISSSYCMDVFAENG